MLIMQVKQTVLCYMIFFDRERITEAALYG